jgi:hypothetical protein
MYIVLPVFFVWLTTFSFLYGSGAGYWRLIELLDRETLLRVTINSVCDADEIQHQKRVT